MKLDGGDLRFANDSIGSGVVFDFLIVEGLNTIQTLVIVRIPSLAIGNSTIFMLIGNPSANYTSPLQTLTGIHPPKFSCLIALQSLEVTVGTPQLNMM